MGLQRVRVELARDHDFPEGSNRHGYEFVLPLDAEGRFDASRWKRDATVCTARRFWGKEPDRTGRLAHAGRERWAFVFDGAGGADSGEAIHHLPEHLFREGEYISVHEDDGKTRTFRIVRVAPAAASPRR